MELVRRLGPDPHDGRETPSASGCPDLWELDNGDIAVIGIRATRELLHRLPPTVSCGPDEEIVIIPRAQVRAASADISNL
jgi:hypothetical protein